MDIKTFCFIIGYLSIALVCNGYSMPSKTGGGKCPSYSPVPMFSTIQFQGRWFVSQQFAFQSRRFDKCQHFYFTSVSPTEMVIEGYSTVTEFDKPLSVETDGKSKASNKTNPGAMVWTWDFVPHFKEYVTVLDTDYTDYALIVICHDYVFFHAEYPVLLTRKRLNDTSNTRENNVYLQKALDTLPYRVEWMNHYMNLGIACADEEDKETWDIDKTFSDIITDQQRKMCTGVPSVGTCPKGSGLQPGGTVSVLRWST